MKSTHYFIILIVIIVVGLVVVRNASDGPGSKVTAYDDFAQCLGDSGAIFYGAWWCPHCKEQKEMFDNSSKLPYVECSTPNGQGQLQICVDENITGYPTWKFADGTVGDGTLTLATLSERTGCELPQ